MGDTLSEDPRRRLNLHDPFIDTDVTFGAQNPVEFLIDVGWWTDKDQKILSAMEGVVREGGTLSSADQRWLTQKIWDLRDRLEDCMNSDDAR